MQTIFMILIFANKDIVYIWFDAYYIYDFVVHPRYQNCMYDFVENPSSREKEYPLPWNILQRDIFFCKEKNSIERQ